MDKKHQILEQEEKSEKQGKKPRNKFKIN